MSDRASRACPRVSIVTPVFNEAASLDAYCAEVSRVLFSRSDVYFEVLFVDDGSTDRSWSMIEQVLQRVRRASGDCGFRAILAPTLLCPPASTMRAAMPW